MATLKQGINKLVRKKQDQARRRRQLDAAEPREAIAGRLVRLTKSERDSGT